MKRKRHTPEQAVRKVREGERMLAAGSDLAEVLRHLEITESTWHRWRRTYAGMIDADGVVATVERLVAGRGAPAHLRMDNGPELVSAALRDWCRILGTHTAYIEPGSPWETPFNGRLRDECLNIEDFANITEARAVLEDWRAES